MRVTVHPTGDAATPACRIQPTSPQGRARPTAVRAVFTVTAVLTVLTVLALVVLLVTAFSAHADPPPPAPSVPSSVDVVLTNIRNWIMGILAGLATVFLTIGGVRYVLAGGDPGEVERAKSSFKSAGWGYGLAALAPLVVSILKQLVGVQ